MFINSDTQVLTHQYIFLDSSFIVCLLKCIFYVRYLKIIHTSSYMVIDIISSKCELLVFCSYPFLKNTNIYITTLCHDFID